MYIVVPERGFARVACIHTCISIHICLYSCMFKYIQMLRIYAFILICIFAYTFKYMYECYVQVVGIYVYRNIHMHI